MPRSLLADTPGSEVGSFAQKGFRKLPSQPPWSSSQESGVMPAMAGSHGHRASGKTHAQLSRKGTLGLLEKNLKPERGGS